MNDTNSRGKPSRVFFGGLICALFLLQPVGVCVALHQWYSSTFLLNYFSYTTVFNCLVPAIAGFALAPVVSLAFVLAWSPRSRVFRVVAVSLLFVVANLIVLVGYCLASVVGTDYTIEQFWVEIQPYLGELVAFICPVIASIAMTILAFSLVPILMRSYRGWMVVSDQAEQYVISRAERRSELFLLAVTIVVSILLGTYWSPDSRIFAIPFVAAIAISVAVTFAFHALLQRKNHARWSAFLAIFLIVAVVIPAVAAAVVFFFWDPDPYWSLIFVAPSAMFATLVIELFLFRAMGFRMADCEFESAIEKAKLPQRKTVVDPFSD